MRHAPLPDAHGWIGLCNETIYSAGCGSSGAVEVWRAKRIAARIAGTPSNPLIRKAQTNGRVLVSKSGKPALITTITEKAAPSRSEEHKSELQSLMSISYAVFCLKKNKNK